MCSGWLARSAMAAAAAMMVCTGFVSRSAVADDRQVAREDDDPPGCTTAKGEDFPQCGAQGRDHFASSAHRPPVKACETSRSEQTGSVVTRVLPDGPRRPDGTLAFIPGACVYLPPGYESGALRYPVVYLLHGGGGDQADWVTFGGIRKILDDAYAADPSTAIIAVMPDGRNGQWFDYADDSFLIQTYILRHLIPWIDSHLRTIPDRRGRAITGLSNGGYGAFHMAGRAPDLFAAAGSMSGNLGAYDFRGLYTEMAPGVKGAATYFQGSLPSNLIPNLDHVDLTFEWGATCAPGDVLIDGCATWAFEQMFRPENQHFRDQLEAQQYAGEYEYREVEGAHAWRWWTLWLRTQHLPFFRARLSPPEPDRGPPAASPLPPTFRYRSTFDRFTVWGYDVTAHRKAREFLEMNRVTVSGFDVVGSGRAEITTAGRYVPGRRYLLQGTGRGEEVVRADRRGRLAVSVDLGAPHETEQYYTPEGETGRVKGDYFTTRHVVITPAR